MTERGGHPSTASNVMVPSQGASLMASLRKTPLHAVHTGLGARFTDFAGRRLCAQSCATGSTATPRRSGTRLRPGHLKCYGITPARSAGQDVLLARTGYTGEDGFEIYCRPAAAPDIWQAVSPVGAPYGLLPCGLACRDALRLEAGMPLYGQEITVRTTKFDAGLGRVVVFGKRDG
ncbi:MAG: hypothetical protein HOV83_09765, partial [Catenulispora sp.]|nr:hypothetical protein [Catenulispora sp.]